ncbi:TadE/TadG family type IV pilus assembly protein [Paenibacillus sp. Leaf72]|uniref:TadE/TadG family type IV pilus assembly protein n=1 Tax=Paenibacillus sp. Leaf72 TaxID=1736234 RepID=UPI0009D74287|nr:TadE/TadG family type IV pilus assembly protein [Paenibacillus sp. Leaf72]
MAAMKRRRRLAGHTDCREGERGSIVMEAALVMPMLLLVLMVFIIFIRMSTLQIALQAAASQSARQIAAHIYPVELAYQRVSASKPEFSAAQMPLADWSAAASNAAKWLPDPAGALASSALSGDWKPLIDMAATEIGRGAIEPLLRQNADEAVLETARIKLSRLALPDLKNKQQPYLIIEAEYEFPMQLPFMKQKLILREQASERVWISDAAAAQDTAAQNDPDHIPIQIISISPVPLRPGHKATAIVLTKPGVTASLKVMYKSGQSQAKHLGEATAGSDGFVQWTWLVSGNTTPGMWELTAGVGDQQASMHFQVEKKSN